MEPHRRPGGRRNILLPFEVDLCHQLGITTEEFEEFISAAEEYVKERPKEYAHIPDIQNTGLEPATVAIIQIVIGLALTAASVLLAPKPRAPKQEERLANLDIPGSQGRSRYTKRSNFDSVQSLAALGETIPLVFADRYDANDPSKSYGGIRIDTQLLYSQLVTAGTTQTLIALAMIGAGRLADTPDYAGYAIGDLLLRDYSPWKNQLFFRPDGGRPTKNDQYEESKLNIADEDQKATDAFACFDPRRASKNGFQQHFSGTRTTSTATNFGLFNPLPNGHRFYMPYQLAMVPRNLPDQADSKVRANDIRKKQGTGWPRLGGIKNSGQEGDIVTYQISGTARDVTDGYEVITNVDVTQTQNETRNRIDEIIQEGQEYMLGETRAICIRRPDTIFDDTAPVDKAYEFEITWRGGQADLPVVGDISVLKNDERDKGGAYPWERGCVQQYLSAKLSNSRPCNATEIGIRSEVWRQISGSANFNEHPSFEVIDEYEEEGASINLGQITKYTKRYSFFRLFARKFGDNNWKRIDDTPFAVLGRSPEYLFNTLYVQHDFGQHEFEFIPVAGAEFYNKFSRGEAVTVYLLDGTPLTRATSNDTPLNDKGYKVYFTGKKEQLVTSEVTNNEWIFGKPEGGKSDEKGPILKLYEYDNGKPIPVTLSDVLRAHEYVTSGSKSMVVRDKDTGLYTFYWRGSVIATDHLSSRVNDENPGGDRKFRYGIHGDDTGFGGQDDAIVPYIPTSWGETDEEYKVDFFQDIPQPDTYCVIKKDNLFYYYWNGKSKVEPFSQGDTGWVIGNDGRRYERSGKRTDYDPDKFVDIEGQEDLFKPNPAGDVENPTTGVRLRDNGVYQFFRNGDLIGESLDPDKSILTDGQQARYVRTGLERPADPGGALNFIRSERSVNCSGKCETSDPFSKMLNGALRLPKEVTLEDRDQLVYFNNGIGLGTIRLRVNEEEMSNEELELEVFGSGSLNGVYRVDWSQGAEDLIFYTPTQQYLEVYYLDKFERTPKLDALYAMKKQKRTVVYDTWEISRQARAGGQDGQWEIARWELDVETVVSATYSVNTLRASATGTKPENNSATVDLVTYTDPEDDANTRYEWELKDKGNNYEFGEQVRVVVPGVTNDPKTTVKEVKTATIGLNETGKNYEEFIKEGNNYFPLNAICDYSINNTDRSSHESSPEHSIIFCNEIINEGEEGATYKAPLKVDDQGNEKGKIGLAIAGIKLINAREWTSFSSLSAYIKRGHEVVRIRDTNNTVGATNLFPEIAYHLLTDDRYGAAELVGAGSVDIDAMRIAAQFCKANGFYWDGIITENQNLRSFIFENAAYMLLDFTIKGGKFALFPSVPYKNNYEIDYDASPEIRALFTDGNIRNMEVSFLSPEERQPFVGVALYRDEVENGFHETRTVKVHLRDGSEADPVEEFDLTSFCTSYDHAKKFLQYAIRLRTEVDHSIKFETTPQCAMYLEPGDYFRVASYSSHVERFESGSIDFSGVIQSANTYNPGDSFDVISWRPKAYDESDLRRKTLTVGENGLVTDVDLHGTVFCRVSDEEYSRIYKCESISYSDEGFIEVAGSVAPLLDSGALAVLQLDDNDFDVEPKQKP